MLRAAQARNSLAQPQLRAAYSSLSLQSRALRSRSGNGICRGQDWCASLGAFAPVAGPIGGCKFRELPENTFEVEGPTVNITSKDSAAILSFQKS
jgi:hypothetical protein